MNTIGLDMWLYAKKFLWNDEEELKKKVGEIFKNIDFEAQEVKFKVYDWREANAIHKWFVDNVQDGNDDWRYYEVSWGQLRELLDAINKVLGEKLNVKEKIVDALNSELKERAEEFLPTTEGSFFGGREYDEYYIKYLKDTKEMLDNLFKNKDKYEGLYFEYTSSW